MWSKEHLNTWTGGTWEMGGWEGRRRTGWVLPCARPNSSAGMWAVWSDWLGEGSVWAGEGASQ